MTHAIVFVPGKSPKPPPAVHREYLWRCLRRGVSRVDPVVGEQLDSCRFTLAAWNALYYQRDESLAADVSWVERLIDSDGVAAEDIKEARHWSKSLTKFMYAMGDRAHWLIKYLPDRRVKAMIGDTLRYFENIEGIAGRIRDIVKIEIRRACDHSGSVCLIGHSMGSVIAYESLWEQTHEDPQKSRIDLFLTLGSPLGMNYVQNKLLGLRDGTQRYPAGIGKWVNVSAVGDIVSVDECVGDDFATMMERGLVDGIEDIHREVYTAFRNDQGLNPHRSYGYLVHSKVGESIAHWWRAGLNDG